MDKIDALSDIISRDHASCVWLNGETVFYRDVVAALLSNTKELEAKLKIATEALVPFAKAGELFDTGKYQQRAASIYSPAAGEEFSLSSSHLLNAAQALARIKEI